MVSHPLVERYFDGDCSPEELATLRAWLKESAEHRDAFARDSLLYLGLADTLRAATLSDEIDGLSQLAQVPEDGDGPSFEELLESLAPGDQPAELVDITPRVLAEVAQARRDAVRERMQIARRQAVRAAKADSPRFSPWLAVGGVLAACITIAVVLQLQGPDAAAPSTQAPRVGVDRGADPTVAYVTVEHALEAVRKDGRPIQAGQTLPAGEIDLAHGRVQLRFVGGAVLTIESPARLDVIDAGRARLGSGRVYAQASTQSDFVIQTTQGDITAAPSNARAAFGVSVDRGRLEARAFDATIGVRTLGERGFDQHHVYTGRSLQITPEASRVGDADPLGFVSDRELAVQVRAAAGDVEARWLTQAQALRRHEGLVLFISPQLAGELGVEPSLNLAQAATGQATRQRGAARDLRMLATHAGRNGFLFDTDADRLIYELPEALEHLTLSAWVYLPPNSAARDLHALVMAEGDNVGDLHWQLSYLQAGRWTMRTGVQERPPSDDGYPFSNLDTALPASARQGRWCHLATTYDTRQGVTTTYLDGEPVATQPIQYRGPLRLGRVHVGNWKVLPLTDPVSRYFTGHISDIAIFDVTLDDPAVKELYESTSR